MTLTTHIRRPTAGSPTIRVFGPLWVLAVLAFPIQGLGQESGGEAPQEAPAYSMLRAEESYTYLREGSPYASDPFDPIKFVRLNHDGSLFLTVGGEVRLRLEFFDNADWESGRDELYSQRLSVHTALNVGQQVRFFGEVYHGLLSKSEPAFAEDDDLALHQGFLELRLLDDIRHRVNLRVGRQELAYGSARLIGIREGPNIRRSFDAARVIYTGGPLQMEGFFGSEVVTSPGTFDNSRNRDMAVWGLFSRFSIPGIVGSTEAYYFGVDVDQARFDDGIAAERRHSVGIRRFGSLGSAFRYNTEVIFQFGTFGDQNIRAFAVETDFHYLLNSLELRPVLGIRLDYVSGDRGAADGTLNTFNALFTNPAYFGLLSQLTPMNLFDIHPSLTLELSERAEAIVDWDFFWRASKDDGLYSPPRFFARAGDPMQGRFIGHQPGLEFVYRVSRHLTWSTEASYFVSGDYLMDSGDAENIINLATTLSFKY